MAMADTASSKDGEAWGTLEELLLACAISRHGTESWDFISVEVQKRATSRHATWKKSSNNNFSITLTPHDCEQRYHALKCRFDVTGCGNESPTVNQEAGISDGENYVAGEHDFREKLPFMIDELRRLRVEELRREVERHNVSIVSLQSKVKRLEGKKRSSSNAEDEADLRKGADRSDAGDERRGRESNGSTAEVADRSVSTEPSDEPEDRSLNESNSAIPRAAPAQGKESNRIQIPNVSENGEPDPVRPALESEPDKNFSAEKVVGRPSQPIRLGNPGELRASVSGSKREVKELEAREEAKQSSDGQSSASLSMRKRRGWRRSNGAGSGSNEIEVEKLSPANKRVDVKSQPLIRFLEIVRSHKHGLVFQRRLPSQKTQKYKMLIRQHMDVETVESQLERGLYSESHPMFYRDLLLMFTNALLFFRKSSTEHLAARELRKLVSKEIAARKLKLGSEPLQVPDPAAKNTKPPSSSDIVVCRRRRNISSAVPLLKMEESLEAVENGDVKAELSTVDDHRKKGSNGKDTPMKLKRDRSNLRTSNKSADDASSALNLKRRKEGVVNFVKTMNRDSPSKEEEESAKVMDAISKKKAVVGHKTPEEAPKTRVSGRRSISTTAKKNPQR